MNRYLPPIFRRAYDAIEHVVGPILSVDMTGEDWLITFVHQGVEQTMYRRYFEETYSLSLAEPLLQAFYCASRLDSLNQVGYRLPELLQIHDLENA